MTTLDQLHIRGLGVIDDAELPLGPGLTVVTGETGAGKTMVVTGLLLLFGGRADATRVRSGAEQASVEGRVELAPGRTADAAAERVRAAGGDLDDGTGLVLRRVVSASGRSRAHVGGAAAPVAVLAELGERLLAVHGQSEQVLLTRPAEQRALLDRYAGLSLDEYRAGYESWRAADAALRDRTEHAAQLRRESDLLTHGLAEIEAADPQPGEDTELAALAARLGGADALRLAARTAHDALVGDAELPMADAPDVTGLLGGATRSLGPVSGADPQLDGLAERLTDLSALVLDLAGELGGYVEHLDADPARLEQVEQRRAVLTALVRKYADGPIEPGGSGIGAVLDWARRAAARAAEIDVSDEALAALAARRDAAATEAAELASRLGAARAAAATRLAEAVTGELAGLAMAAARLHVEVRPRPAAAGTPTLRVAGGDVGAGPDGTDEVEFRLQPHPTAAPLPLGRGASGGELSRVMLALEVCCADGADTDSTPIMVFDEVDAGVGGRAATEVGRRLARLARDRQVIVVTHLAQVAVFADRQVVVAAPSEPGASVLASDVHPVSGPERVAELARMLAGSDSGTALEHAAELLSAAQADRTADADRPAPQTTPRTAAPTRSARSDKAKPARRAAEKAGR